MLKSNDLDYNNYFCNKVAFYWHGYGGDEGWASEEIPSTSHLDRLNYA